MRLGVIVGTPYSKVGGQYYTYTSYHAEMWKECLVVFDEVVLLDKVTYHKQIPVGQKPVIVDGVSFIEYPIRNGCFSLLCALPRMFLVAKRAVRQADVWNLHAPDVGTFCLWFWARIYDIPYMLELRGDQSMTVTYLKLRGVRLAWLVAHIMRLVLWFERSMPLFLVSVSKSLLRDFPPRNNCHSFVISDNRIPEAQYGQERVWQNDSKCRIIVCVGRVEAQKNPLGTMRALAKLDNLGFTNWKFVWAGEGPLREKTERLAEELGLSDRVDFRGFVPWDDIFGLLDRSDLFLLNSVCEGLPRSLVEAMARGLPAVASDVGGVLELLSPEDVVPMTDDDALTEKLYQVLRDNKRLAEMSRRNLQTAKTYSAEILSSCKKAFYKQLRERVEQLKTQREERCL